MADSVSTKQLESFLQELGKRYPKSATLYLLGGSALVLLGGNRPTLDIDYVGIDIPGLWDELQHLIDELASEMGLKVDAVPYQEMIPPLADAANRHIRVGEYGRIHVYIFDPYGIALGKLDRGFPSDLEDVVFLIRRNLISLTQLEKFIQDAIPSARQFDLNPKQMQKNLDIVRRMFGRQARRRSARVALHHRSESQ